LNFQFTVRSSALVPPDKKTAGLDTWSMRWRLGGHGDRVFGAEVP